ncbi:hypothetical protein QAD02_011128 [Eretmocerus hayati]|uniref:Uncharacterized protein n=1 Tax=Eretmocerus hayati TaxID=131215 RepID=A0ACC2NYN3_9HYME|nr:hypothetical protein QAD02_011128 [Eretmocerus hayati]
MSYTDENEHNIERIIGSDNFYEILRIPEDASQTEIKSAHNKLVLLVHPDKNRAPGATDAFRRVKIATACLLDEDKRLQYDEQLRQTRNSQGKAKSVPGPNQDFFNMSDDAVNGILIGAGIATVLGIDLLALFATTRDKRN